ncbi:MAG: hypothetical protein ACYDD6_09880 [Acidimicrobiales bacterium]
MDRWYEDSQAALDEHRRDPEFMAMLRRKIDQLKNKKTRGGRRLPHAS